MRLPWRTPYRWLWRTWRHNVSHIFSDIIHGIANIFRWIPRIWFDNDYNWACLAEIMEYKLDRLGRSIQYGHHLYGERDARRIRTCVTLIRRLRADNYYWDEAKKVYGETGFAAQLAADNQRNDQRHLGVLLGKYLTHWWD